MKAVLRKQFLDLYSQVPDSFNDESDQRLFFNLGHFLYQEFLKGTFPQEGELVFGLFASQGHEPSLSCYWSSIALELQQAFPKLKLKLSFPDWQTSRLMEFKLCDFEDLVEEGSFLKPPSQALTVVPKILLVPGLAFDLAGQRLGRGAGHYDRYLQQNQIYSIGLGYEYQVMNRFPQEAVEAHDQKLTILLTEKKAYRFVA